jgi:dipeptidyl aminopeptidase/acylaminoacyl peptidase
MFAKYKWVYCLALFAVCAPVLQGQKKNVTFSLPDSILLFGTYNDIRIVTPSGMQSLKPPGDLKTNEGYFAFPSISPRGDLIAWGFAVALDKKRNKHHARYALGIYSTSSQAWKTYGNFDDIGYTAFSGDGSKVAFVAEADGKDKLLIFDVATENMSNTAYPHGMPESGGLSWSPDGTQLAVVIQRGEKPSQIAALDLKTGNAQPIGEGYQPAWSPTGEWIAYYSGQKCMLVHPDGTGTKTAKDVGGGLGRYRSFNGGLVWSSDGNQLLLNEVKGDGPKLNVMLLDLPSGRFIRKSEDGLPVFGWVAQQQQ